MDNLFIVLIERMSVIAILAFLLTRAEVFRRLLLRQSTVVEKIFFILFFGLFGIIGTYTGVPIKGAIANSRVIGAVAGGLLGGPLVGLGAGLIAGLHRFSLGGFTALACGLSTTVEGLIGGLFSSQNPWKNVSWKKAFAVGVLSETIQMVIILAVAKPFSAAWDLVSIIGLPMIVVNSIGLAIFMVIVRLVYSEQDRIGAMQAHRALKIADKTLPYLRQGLNEESAKKVAEIIYQSTELGAVAITDRYKILAHVGAGEDHHRPGEPLLTEATQNAIATGQIQTANNAEEIGCRQPGCSLRSAVIVPLKRREEVIGALKLYKLKEGAIGRVEREFAHGLAHLFSTQLELAQLEYQARLAAAAEIKALQAQINPHFLFNALNTIVSYVRTNPENARRLLIHLGEFFRKNLEHCGDFVTLEREIEHIKAYLAIEEARFKDVIKIEYDIVPELLQVKLPALILQPLVENALKHGLLPQKEGGLLRISARKVVENGREEMRIVIADNGVGMSADRVNSLLRTQKASGYRVYSGGAGVGLTNVNERLVSIYGPEYGLKIDSELGKGTTVKISVPLDFEPENRALLTG
ncbi:sensor histidine kinase [Calderihabitans maritimus]|uniref:histidine kinase n=1 Tax=Calderihabitans maritimus TaxID=1246530 RepID=A0A1Z5HQ83_9FIRM|nr:sensor histidine kinase [Calderihabitans maritimus]GAW91689.1 sensor histidine kinase LytS, GAF domain-containing [Calderihabitans maritimus]